MRFAKALEVLCLIAWILFALLVNSLLQAWAMSVLWRWFAAPQYGSGPSIGAWFGLAMIANLALQGAAEEQAIRQQLREDEPSMTSMISKSLWRWAGILFTIGVAWCLGSALHWIR
jgi:ABC-type sugar transport system permease subunit